MDLSANFQQQKKINYRDSDEDLNLEKDSSFESESDSAKAKKVRVNPDSTEEEESGGLVVEKDNGILEKTVSREIDLSLEKAGSCSGGSSSTEKSEATVAIADDEEDERMGKIDIDLNFPPLQVIEDDEEGGIIESGCEGIGYKATMEMSCIDGETVEVICIDLEDGKDEGERYVGGRESGSNGSSGLDLGGMEADSYAEGTSSSMSGRRRYTREEKGKAKLEDA